MPSRRVCLNVCVVIVFCLFWIFLPLSVAISDELVCFKHNCTLKGCQSRYFLERWYFLLINYLNQLPTARHSDPSLSPGLNLWKKHFNVQCDQGLFIGKQQTIFISIIDRSWCSLLCSWRAPFKFQCIRLQHMLWNFDFWHTLQVNMLVNNSIILASKIFSTLRTF